MSIRVELAKAFEAALERRFPGIFEERWHMKNGTTIRFGKDREGDGPYRGSQLYYERLLCGDWYVESSEDQP